MKRVFFSLFFGLFIVKSFSQVVNLIDCSKEVRDEYLVNKAREATLNFGPEFYRDTLKYSISAIKTFVAPEWWREDMKRQSGRLYYTVTLFYNDSTLERKRYSFASQTDIWEDDGQPSGIDFGSGLGFEFFSRSYQDVLKDDGHSVIKFDSDEKVTVEIIEKEESNYTKKVQDSLSFEK